MGTDPSSVVGVCDVCGGQAVRFEEYGLPPRPGRCSACGAKPRHRAILWYLSHGVAPRLAPGAQLLEVGPGKIATRYLTGAAALGPARYVGIDVRALRHHRRLSPPHRFVRMDVTRLGFADAAFDVIVCNNTLTYVRDDAAALREMYRCLTPSGLLMIQTHRGEPWTRSAAEHRALHPELGDDWFAENGDQWVYGPDFFERVEAAGLRWRIDRPLAGAAPDYLRRHGLKSNLELIVAFRSAAGEARFQPPED